MPSRSYAGPLGCFMYPSRTVKIEPVKCECCGIGNKPDKNCPVCNGTGVKKITTMY